MKKDLTDGYLEAAEIVDRGERTYSCHAVMDAFPLSDFHRPSHPEVERYAAIFSPTGSYYGFVSCVEGEFGTAEQTRDFRVLMLCFMAACWKDFGEGNKP